MNEIKKVLLCGMGAIGSIYANKIIDFDNSNFRVLLDNDRLKSYKDNPVLYNNKVLEPTYVLPVCKDFKADLIIIATKYSALDAAINNIKNFVKNDTIILSLLNGVSSENLIAQRYGAEKLLYSYVIGHSSVRIGRNITHDGVCTLVVGSNGNEAKLKQVVEYCKKAEIDYEVPDDIMYSMWLKYMLNVSSNQVSAVLRYNFGEILNNEKCIEFVINVMKEVQQVAEAEGVKNTDKMLYDALAKLKTMLPEGRTSMLQDIEAGRKTEVDMFAGEMIKFGKKHNIPTPYNTVLKGLIEIIERTTVLTA